MYLDGSQVGTLEVPHAIGYATNDPFQIGSIPNRSYDFPGLIDEVKLWDVALDATQVQALYDRDRAR